MARIDETDFMDAIARHAGTVGLAKEEQRRWVRGALAVITRDLARVDQRALANELPETLLETTGGEQALEPRREKELVESVLCALGETLSAETRARMRKHLPSALGELLSPREISEPPSPAHPARESVRPRSTLASGRPGSAHPLSEARPETAHRHSVARSDDPHADTKLSSAHGTTQERMHETLAEAEPPHPTRTIAED